MAEVIITFDTKAKSTQVTIDGKEMADVVGVELYRGYYEADSDEAPKFRFGLTQQTRDKDNDVMQMVRTCAAENGSLVKESAKKSVISQIKEFFKV
jgi:hypothetical protein